MSQLAPIEPKQIKGLVNKLEKIEKDLEEIRSVMRFLLLVTGAGNTQSNKIEIEEIPYSVAKVKDSSS